MILDNKDQRRGLDVPVKGKAVTGPQEMPRGKAAINTVTRMWQLKEDSQLIPSLTCDRAQRPRVPAHRGLRSHWFSEGLSGLPSSSFYGRRPRCHPYAVRHASGRVRDAMDVGSFLLLR